MSTPIAPIQFLAGALKWVERLYEHFYDSAVWTFLRILAGRVRPAPWLVVHPAVVAPWDDMLLNKALDSMASQFSHVPPDERCERGAFIAAI